MFGYFLEDCSNKEKREYVETNEQKYRKIMLEGDRKVNVEENT